MKRYLLLSPLLLIAASGPMSAQPPEGAAGKGLPSQAQRANDMALLLGLRADQKDALVAMLKETMPPPPPRRADGAGNGPNAMPPPDGPTTDGPPPGASDPLASMEHRLEDQRKHLDTMRQFREELDSQQQQRFDALMRLSPGPGFGPPPRPQGPPPRG